MKNLHKIILMFILILLIPRLSFAVNEKINPDLQLKLEVAESEEKVPVIITLKEKTITKKKFFGLISEEVDSQDSLISDLKMKGMVKHKFSIVNGVAAEIPSSKIKELSKDSNVERIELDVVMNAFLDTSAPQIQANKTWNQVVNEINITGNDTTVCIIDSGVNYSHPDLGNCTSDEFTSGTCDKTPDGYDYVNDDSNPMDDHGHGTHCAGIAAGNGGIKGVAPDAKIIAIKSLNSAGSGTTSDIISGIEWCTNNATVYNISVISMSFGTEILYNTYCDGTFPSLTTAINDAIAKNITLVAATGNDGSTTSIGSPACIENATSVGAVNDNDGILYNRNNITDLLAPGVTINSTLYTSGYGQKSGTSMATPHAAGAFALLAQAYKLLNNLNATPEYLESVLNSTGKIIDQNSSRINVFDAFAFMAPPILTLESPLNQTYSGEIVWLNVTINENTSWCGYSMNSSENETMSNDSVTHFYNNVSNISESPQNVTFWCNDTTGNMSSSDIVYFDIDKTGPTITIIEPYNLTYNYKNDIPLKVGLSETQNWCGYSLNKTENSTFTPNTTIDVNEGPNNITVYCNDSLGNMGNSSLVLFTVDTTPPAIILSSPPDKFWNNTLNVNYIFNTTSSNVIMNCSLWTNESGTWAENETNSSAIENGSTNTLIRTYDSGGNYLWNIECTDENGNIGFNVINFTNYVDATYPKLTIDNPVNTNYTNNTIWFNLTIDETKTHTVLVDINDTNHTLTNSSGNWNYLNNTLPDGSWTGRFYVNDSAGNMNNTKTITFIIDTTSPTITFASPTPSNGSTWTSQSTTINASLNETPDWCGLSWNGGINESMTIQNESCYITKSGLSNALYNYTVYANDSLGNMNSSIQWVTISYTPPEEPVTTSGGGGGGGGSVSVTKETQKVSSISTGKTEKFSYTKSDDLSIQEISVKAKESVSDVELTVKESSKPSKASEPISSTTGSTYKYIEITKKNIEDNDIDKATLKFKVTKTWASSNEIDVDTVALKRYTTNWESLETNKLSEDDEHHYYEAESPGFSVFAIIGKLIEPFSMDKEEIRTSVTQGETKKEYLKITNKRNTNITVTVSVKDIDIYLSEKSFVLEPKETKTIELLFVTAIDQKAETYTGKISVKSDSTIKTISSVMNVLSKGALFDVKVEIPTQFRKVLQGEEVFGKIDIFNVGKIGQVDVVVDYYITDIKGEVISSGKETVAVGTTTSFVRSLKILEKAEPGEYKFNVDVTYDDVVTSSNYAFSVNKRYAFLPDFVQRPDKILGIIIGIILLVILAYLVKREKEIRSMSREIRGIKRRVLLEKEDS